MGDDTYGYAYDPIGNRTQSAAAAGSGAACTNAYAANALNQYTCITNFASFAPSRETLPAYDADGNLTAYGPWAYTWDAENRLVSACSNGVLLVTNVYDHRSRRVRKEVSVWDGQVEAYVPQSSAHYLWDGWNVVRETVAVGSGSTQSVATNYYTWGLDLSGTLQGAGGVGGLLAVLRNGTPYFPCYDANGNVTGYVATNGASVARREYDPFGRTTVAAGAMADDFNFWFSTKYLDRETGMSCYGYRFYAPELGRWPSRDPIEERGGLNLYGFVGNDPVNRWDYLGLWSLNGCCSGTKYNKLTKCCCCNGRVNDGSKGVLLDRKKIVTGIRKCNIAAHVNPSGYPHGWLEVDRFSAGFVPASIEDGAQGSVNIPDARSGGRCSDIKLDPCEYNIETVKQAVKQLSMASQLFPPPYSRNYSNFFVCYTWRDEIINRAKEMGKNKCGTSNTTIELYE